MIADSVALEDGFPHLVTRALGCLELAGDLVSSGCERQGGLSKTDFQNILRRGICLGSVAGCGGGVAHWLVGWKNGTI